MSGREDDFGPTVLRIATFHVPEDKPDVFDELRGLRPWGGSRWIGRRMMDDPGGPEIAVVSTWRSREETRAQIPAGRARFGRELTEAMTSLSEEVYTCRAWGAWQRPERPLLLRIFRGRLVEGSAEDFDLAAMARYVGLFERNPRCTGILAGIDAKGVVVLVSLWTSWDAIVTATGGDLRQVLPMTLPGWAVGGSADHYELVTAESDPLIVQSSLSRAGQMA